MEVCTKREITSCVLLFSTEDSKGQLILKCPFGVFKSSKKPTKFFPKGGQIKKIADCDGWIIPGTKMTITRFFLWNVSSKIQFFTDISTISVRGCRGQPMILF
jgi:hypothetical protein